MPSACTNIDDYRWLVSPHAQSFLDEVASSAASLVTLTKRLRTALSPARAHLVLEQVALRERARAKFSKPEKMFFTRKLLEQATDEQIASYKASRFPVDLPMVDLCCGIGGDLLALSQRGSCLAIDRDPVATLLAEANSRSLQAGGVSYRIADVHSVVEELKCAAWHLDPDRRMGRQRTTQVVYSEPGPEILRPLLRQAAAGAIKMAPSAEFLQLDHVAVELEWVGSRRECRQQVAWLGDLARHAGQRTATVVDPRGGINSFTGDPDVDVHVSEPGRYLLVPDSTLIASRLVGSLAEQLQLRATSHGPSYYTADEYRGSPLLSTFEVHELLAFDVRRLKRLLRDRRIGRLEVKTRGVEIDPGMLRKKLRPKGDESASLLIFRSGEKVVAALTQRC